MKQIVIVQIVIFIFSAIIFDTRAQNNMWGRIDSTTIINGHLCFVYNYGTETDLFGTNYLFEVNGFIRTYAEWHYQLGFFLYDTLISYMMKQNPQVGDTWFGGGYYYPVKYTVIGMEMITVPAGTFLTYKVEGRDPLDDSLEEIAYFTDSVGLVRSVDYEDNFEIVLTSYTVQGGGCFPLAIGNEWLFNIILVGVADYTHDSPVNFNLCDAYPNPFNPTTTIKYSVPEQSFLTLKVYDVLGNEIATLVNEEKPAGSYEVNFNAIGLPSGIYFYKLQTGSFIETKKMIVIK